MQPYVRAFTGLLQPGYNYLDQHDVLRWWINLPDFTKSCYAALENTTVHGINMLHLINLHKFFTNEAVRPQV